MKPQYLFQLFILPALLFSPIGNSGRVQAGVNVNTESSVTTSVNPTSVDIGDTALVSVSLNNVPDGGYASAEFTCTYGTNFLEASNIVVSNLFGADAVTVISGPQNGKFILAIAGSNGNKVTTNGTVFTFSVKGLQAGQVEIECTARISKGDKILSNIPSVGTSLNVFGDGTPGPTPFTPTPTVSPTTCDKAQFIADITVPPGTLMFPGATFRKTWRFKNVGSCVWNTSYQLIFHSGTMMSAPSPIAFPVNVLVGQTVDLSIFMTAPLAAGSYRGYWMFRNANGELFGVGPQGNEPFLVDINVSIPTSTPVAPANSPTPTVTPGTPTNSPTPSVTPGGPSVTPTPGVVFDFVANACSASWFSYAGQLPCPGIDGNEKGFVLIQSSPKLEDGTISTRPGLLTFPQNIHNGYIQGVYPPFKVQSGDRFRSIVGCEGGATNCYVIFRLEYAIGSDPTIKTFWAFVERHEGVYYSADIDLSPLAGQDVRFILTVSSTGSASDDRALWVAPIIYRTDAGSTPAPSPTPTPTITLITTQTEVPGIITISGKVIASKTVVISLYNADNSLFISVPANVDGSFSFAIPSGIYSVKAVATESLSARSDFVLTSTGNRNMQTISLPAGDIDNNNIIDQFDALTIGMNYNSALPNVADLNNDGVINVLDLELLARNYRKVGPLAWQ